MSTHETSTTLTHIDDHGAARMVDVSAKAVTRREATAQAVVTMRRETREAIEGNALAKGDVLAVARIAAIMAAKRVDSLIPLCHSLPLSEVRVEFQFQDDTLRIEATAATVAQTGVEMEALTAASIAALTVYDMAKAIDKRMVIGEIKLLKKSGGKSGEFTWESSESES